jgi:hypothetical protein
MKDIYEPFFNIINRQICDEISNYRGLSPLFHMPVEIFFCRKISMMPYYQGLREFFEIYTFLK